MTNLALKFFFYFILLFSWEFIPDAFWDQFLNLYERRKGHWHNLKMKIPLLGSIYRGEELLLTLADCEAKVILGIKLMAERCPKYKFYTDLLEQFLENHRRLGIGIKKIFPEFRAAIVKDLQFEKKILDETLAAFLQFFIIAVTTWGFVFLTRILVAVPLSLMTVFIMILLQSGGVLSFFILMKYFKAKRFFAFSSAIEEAYLFSSLLEVGLPLNEVLTRSRILEGSLFMEKKFTALSERLKKVIDRMKETGLSPKEETSEIIRELWHLQEIHFVKFTKLAGALKFMILAFFFLPAYFLFLASIFKFFMDQ